MITDSNHVGIGEWKEISQNVTGEQVNANKKYSSEKMVITVLNYRGGMSAVVEEPTRSTHGVHTVISGPLRLFATES